MVRILAVLHVLSVVIMIFALCLIFPLAWSFFLRDAAQAAYDDAIVLTAFAGCCFGRLRARSGANCSRATVFCWWRCVDRAAAFATLRCCCTCRNSRSPTPTSRPYPAHHHGGDRAHRPGRAAAVDQHLAHFSRLGRRMGVIVLAVASCPAGRGRQPDLQGGDARPMKDTKLTPRIAETAKGCGWCIS